MLWHADAEVVSRDPALPGLATILDAEALGCAFARETGKSIEGVELSYLRYKPGTNCVGAYRASVDGEPTALYAKAHGPDAQVKLEKSLAAAGIAAARLGLHPEGIVVCTFPDDVKLPVLARLADPAARGSLMERVFDGRPGMETGTLEHLAYKPERRFVAHWDSEAGGAVVKFYTGSGRRVARAGSRAVASGEVLRVARKIGGSKRHGVLAFEWLPGQNLRDVLAGGDPAPAVRLVGRALAELHGQSSPSVVARVPSERARELRELADTLAVLCPGLAARVATLAERVAARLAQEGAAGTCIHGDLYDKQVLIDRDRVGIIDLDRAALGDPRVDVGLLLAHLDRDVLLGRLEGAAAAEIEGVFLDAYQKARGHALGAIGAYIAEALLHLAHHPFRVHLVDWPARTGEIVARAEHRLSADR